MYDLIEDRGYNIRYEVASSDELDSLIVKAINRAEDEENVNGDGDPFTYEILLGTEEVWSSLKDMPVAIGVFEDRVFGPYTHDQVLDRRSSPTRYMDELVYPQDGESIIDLCNRYGIDCV